MRLCFRVVRVCAWLAFAATCVSGNVVDSIPAGPGTLTYQVSETTATCGGRFNTLRYTIYTFEDSSFVATGISQSLPGAIVYRDSPSGVVGCPGNSGLGSTLVLPGTGYSINFTVTGLTSGKAVYNGPFASSSPGTLTFPQTNQGQASGPLAVTVTNAGTTTLSISSVGIAGGNSGDFNQTNNCGSVAAGGSCSVSVTFSPTVDSGTRSSSLVITDNAPGSPNVVALSGSAEKISVQGRIISSGTWSFPSTDSLTVGSGGFTINGTANVTFLAGLQIVLQPGFTASAASGAHFQTQITRVLTVSIAVPAVGATYSNTVTASGSAVDSYVGISNVTAVVDGGTVLGTASYAPSPGATVSWYFPLNTMALSNGAHNFTVIARAADGGVVLQGAAFGVSNAVSNPPNPLLAPTAPKKEYIFLDGKVVAIEN